MPTQDRRLAGKPPDPYQCEMPTIIKSNVRSDCRSRYGSGGFLDQS
jgi:hypothetical protein